MHSTDFSSEAERDRLRGPGLHSTETAALPARSRTVARSREVAGWVKALPPPLTPVFKSWNSLGRRRIYISKLSSGLHKCLVS